MDTPNENQTNPERKKKKILKQHYSGQRPGRPSPAHDWEEIKAFWLTSALSQNDIASKFKVSAHTLSVQIRNGGWKVDKKKLKKRTLQRVISKHIDKTAKEWGQHVNSFKKINKQIQRILNKYDKDPNKLMDPQDLKTLAGALNETLKGQKLIKGESTGEETHISFHMKTVQFIQEREKEVEKQSVIDAEADK